MVCLQLSLYMILAQEAPFKHSKTPVSHFVAWCYDMEKGKHIDFIQNVIHPELFLCLSVLLPWRLSLPQFPTSPLKAVWFCIFNLIFHSFFQNDVFWPSLCTFAALYGGFRYFSDRPGAHGNPWGLSEGPQHSLQKTVCMWCVVISTIFLCVPAALEGFNERPTKFMYACLTVYSQFSINLVMVRVIIWPLDFSITLALFVGQPWCYR